MKHLKKFNEELSPSTYRRASNKLDLLGRKSKNAELIRRAKSLAEYAEDKLWKENIKNFSKYGKTTITTKCKKGTISGDFYLLFDFDYYGFEQMYQDNLNDEKLSVHFTIGFIPVDLDTKNKFIEILPVPDFDNGYFFGLWISLDFKDRSSGLEFSELSLSNYDTAMNGDISFTRPLCGLIKKHLVACFSSTDNYLHFGDNRSMYDVIEEEVLVKSGASSEFGITMEYFQDVVKKITPNALMASI